MTQNFTVVEAQTEKKGVNVPVKNTVEDVKAILEGKVDKLKPEDLLYIGTLKDVEHKLTSASIVKTAESDKNDTQNNKQPAPSQADQSPTPAPQSAPANTQPTEPKKE